MNVRFQKAKCIGKVETYDDSLTKTLKTVERNQKYINLLSGI